MQNVYNADGTQATSRPTGYAQTGLQVITATGSSTYTPTSGTRAVLVYAMGGGASGGSSVGASNAAAGSGGGGGALSIKFITGITGTYTVVVGAGGTTPSSGNVNGNDGNDRRSPQRP
jgi:hypothetical protein